MRQDRFVVRRKNNYSARSTKTQRSRTDNVTSQVQLSRVAIVKGERKLPLQQPEGLLTMGTEKVANQLIVPRGIRVVYVAKQAQEFLAIVQSSIQDTGHVLDTLGPGRHIAGPIPFVRKIDQASASVGADVESRTTTLCHRLRQGHDLQPKCRYRGIAHNAKDPAHALPSIADPPA